MGLFDPTSHRVKTTRTSFFGTPIVVTHCGKEYKDQDVEPGPPNKDWFSRCGKCERRANR